MKRTPFLMAAIIAFAACEAEPEVDSDAALADMPAAQVPTAAAEAVTVELLDADGQSVGTVELTEQAGGVQFAVHIMGLAPGEHGFHVHETGSCVAPDFTSAGGHFAPAGNQHGTQNPQGPHAGDLPNLTVGDNNMADTSFLQSGITLAATGETSLFRDGGTALVVHEGPDDYMTDPSGDSGSRVACGVIEPR